MAVSGDSKKTLTYVKKEKKAKRVVEGKTFGDEGLLKPETGTKGIKGSTEKAYPVGKVRLSCGARR